jgi:hypothetical protein
MDTVLALVGILLTIALAPPILTTVSRWVRRLRARRRWSPNRQVDRGEISKLSHYGFEFWRQTIDIDSHGKATHTVDARLINLDEKLLRDVTFPIYGDASDVPESIVSSWATVRRKRLSTNVEDWLPQRARGRIRVVFDPPVRPGQRLRFRWGYELPATFAPGDEYYNYDVANPFDELTLEFKFDSRWTVLYARWHLNLAGALPPPRIDGNNVKWTLRFPVVGRRVQMLFGLTQAPVP